MLLSQNIRDNNLVDPTIDIPDREEYFKLDNRGLGLYRNPTPGLLDNIKNIILDNDKQFGILYGTFNKSMISPKEFKDVKLLETIPGTDSIKFVSLVEFPDYDAELANAESRLNKLKEQASIFASSNARSGMVSAMNDAILNDSNRISEYTILSILPKTVEEYIDSNFLIFDYATYSQFRNRLNITVPEYLEILNKWKYEKVSSAQQLDELDVYITPSLDNKSKWVSTKMINIPAGDNNFRLISLNKDDLKHHRVILPSLQDDVYVL